VGDIEELKNPLVQDTLAFALVPCLPTARLHFFLIFLSTSARADREVSPAPVPNKSAEEIRAEIAQLAGEVERGIQSQIDRLRHKNASQV
jgi:hypothetical protein